MIGVLSLGGYNNINGETVKNTFATIISSTELDSTTPMYVSMRPMTGSFADGPTSDTFPHFYTFTGYTYEYDCDCNVINSGQVTDSPIYQRGKDIGEESAEVSGFVKSYMGTNIRTEVLITKGDFDNSTLEYKATISSVDSFEEENHYDDRSPYSNVLNSSSFYFARIISKEITSYTDVSTYLTIDVSSGGFIPTCCGNTTRSDVSVVTGTTTSYSGTVSSNTFFNRNQKAITSFASKDTYVSQEFVETSSFKGGMNISYSNSKLNNLNFTIQNIYTENTENSFSILSTVGLSGNDSYLDVGYEEESLSLGAYFNTHYLFEECQNAFTANWGYGLLGKTSLFSDVFLKVGGGNFIVYGDSVKQKAARESSESYSIAYDESGNEVGVYNTTKYEKVAHVASFNDNGDFWKPQKIFFNPEFNYIRYSGLPDQVYKAYSDLSKNRSENLYESYNISVNRTLNSGKYPDEYNSRKSGILASVGGISVNLFQVATANSNDRLEMKKPVTNLIAYSETEALPSPWGGYDYLVSDPTSVGFKSGAYSYTLYDMKNTDDISEGSFVGESLFELNGNNLLSINSLCVVVYGGETYEDMTEFIGPAGKANNLVAISESNCGIKADSYDFFGEMATFNNMNFPFVNRKTEQTYYPITPGFII